MNSLYRRGTAVSGQGRISSRLRLALCYAVAVASLTATLAHSATLSEDDLLLLDVMLERKRLATSITAYNHNGAVLVSLAEMGGALEFPIDVNVAAGRASGYFINPQRRFELSLSTSSVEVDGKRFSYSADEVVVQGDSIFVAITTLARWFPVDFELQMRSLSIAVAPRESLPVQTREQRRSEAGQISMVGPATLPPVNNDYRLLGPHALDLGVGYSIRRNQRGDQPTTGLTYSALLAGDVAYMDSRIYLGGDKNDALTNFRASLSRSDLNGPLGLRYVEIGDILPPQVSGVVGGSVERGLLIQGGGSATGRDDLIDGDQIRIAGDALEGWDVELFQNGMRIGFQTVGLNGRYSFENIEPLAGENDFELVFYGPNGEQRREKVTRYSGLTPDQPGSVRYQFSVSQKGQQLYDPQEDDYLNQQQDLISNRGSLRMAAGVDVRVLSRLSLRAAWNSVEVNDKRLNYYTLGARAGLGPSTFGIDATRDPYGGTRWDASLQLPAGLDIWGFDTRFVHSQYLNFVPEDENDTEQLNLNSRTGVTITGPIGPVATRFSAFHNRASDYSYNVYTAGFTSHLKGVHFGSNLNYEQFGKDSSGFREEDRVTGNVFFTSRSGPISLRGGANYTISPVSEFNRYYIDSNLRVARDMSMTFGLSYDPLREITRYTAGLNWHMPQVILSPRLNYDSDGEYSGFLYATLSMGPRPDRTGVMFSSRSLANNGAVMARVFLDKDGNGVFSSGDQVLQGVKVLAPQAGRTATTDAEGVAQLTALSADRPTDIMIDPASLPSTSMVAAHGGNSVQARATTTTLVDFPIMLTGEIEGRVLSQRNGGRAPMAGALVELLDPQGQVVAFKASAHDGFFVFEGVPFGNYTVTLGGTRRTQVEAKRVSLSETRSDLRGVDLLVRDVASAAPPAASIQPVSAPPAPPVAVVPPLPSPQASVRPAVQEPVRVPTQPAAPRAGSDGRLVQLGAFSSAENAQTELNRLVGRGVLQANQATILASDSTERGILHRIVLSPGSGSAESACRTIKVRGGACISIDPKVL